MSTKLNVVLGQTFDKKPLATIDGFPGGDAEMRPEQLRALAKTLLLIAVDAESQPMGPRKYRQQKREYTL